MTDKVVLEEIASHLRSMTAVLLSVTETQEKILSEMQTQTELMQSTHAMQDEALGMQRQVVPIVLNGEADRKRQSALIDQQIAASEAAMREQGLIVGDLQKN